MREYRLVPFAGPRSDYPNRGDLVNPPAVRVGLRGDRPELQCGPLIQSPPELAASLKHRSADCQAWFRVPTAIRFGRNPPRRRQEEETGRGRQRPAPQQINTRLTRYFQAADKAARMRSPFEIFRRHQKILTVILVGMAMFSFVICGAIQDPQNIPAGLMILAIAALMAGVFWVAGLQSGKSNEYSIWGLVAGVLIGVGMTFWGQPVRPSTRTPATSRRPNWRNSASAASSPTSSWPTPCSAPTKTTRSCSSRSHSCNSASSGQATPVTAT